jgi:exosortase A
MNAVPVSRHSWYHLVLREASGWRDSLVRLGLLAALYLMLFHADLADLVRVWTNSTPYSHCIFLPAIIFWMVWQRRSGLVQLTPQGWWLGLVWLGIGAFTWLLGWAAGVALFRHAALVVMAQGLVLSALGPAVGRALAFPIFYAFFMIPVGTEAEPMLQIVTAKMAIHLLWLAGVPAEISGIFISTPNGYFRVAEACSGTGFLIAMAAFATLVAHLCFKSMVRRALFIGSALIFCLLANGVRAFGIILIAYHSSVDSAVVVDHVLYGWLFFALVIMAMLAIGFPFYDRSPFEQWFDPARLQGAADRLGMGWGLMLAAAVIMVAPMSWSAASRALAQPLPAEAIAPEVPGWHRRPISAAPYWEPFFTGADGLRVIPYGDDRDRLVDLAVVRFAYQAEGKELVGFGQGAAAPDGAGDWTWAAPATTAPRHAHGEIIQGPHGERRLVYSFYRVGGVLTGQAGRVKLETLKVRLLSRDQRAAAILVSALIPEGPDGEARAAQALDDFLTALGPIEDLADRSLAIR